jgi:hypothetical protein
LSIIVSEVPMTREKGAARQSKRDEVNLAARFRRDAPPSCAHGLRKFGGSEYGSRKRSKWLCPTGECLPKVVWLPASLLHPLIPRDNPRWRKLYSHGRAAVEGFHSLAKGTHGLNNLRSRGLVRAQRHLDMALIAMMTGALARASAGLALA